jgi:hypothetical protein
VVEPVETPDLDKLDRRAFTATTPPVVEPVETPDLDKLDRPAFTAPPC